jgi:magnesium transporter
MDDRGGMVVNCAAYSAGRRVADLALEAIDPVLRQDGHFVWIGLYEPDEPLLREIQEKFTLHELAIEDAHRAHQRPKLEEYGGSFFVVLRTAQLAEGRIVFGETHLFAGPHYVVSIRHGASLSYATVRARCETTPHLLARGPCFVVYAVMDFVVDNYFPILDGLEDELEALEEAIFGEQASRDTTSRLYDLKRDLVAFKRAISPLLEMCNRLVRYDTSLVPEDVRPYFRDVYDHVIRINETTDMLRDLLTTALEANLSLISVRQNEVMKKLASWAAILAVPTAIAGIYGMNFDYMPALHARWGYPAVMLAIFGIAGFLYSRFRAAGWL